MLVRQGFVQRMGTSHGKAWPVAENFDDAKRLCDWLRKPDIRVAEIGAVDGETLEGHIALAIADGCQFIACVHAWNEDGSPEWRTLRLNTP